MLFITEILKAAKHNPPSVLLIYLAENQHVLDVVKLIAEFLQDVCYVQPYVIDSDIDSQVRCLKL